MRVKGILILMAMSLSLFLSGCANTGPDAKMDPFENYNRVMFHFNQGFTQYVGEPVTDAYKFAVPGFARTGVRNFFNNLYTVPDVGNDLLQLNWRYFFNDLARFVINSTVGILGLVDVASHIGLPAHTQSFGLTLARWDIWRNAPYFILPFLGPSTLRGAFGMVPDYFMNPITYLKSGDYQYPLYGLYMIQTATDGIPKEKFIIENAIDPYAALRNAYLQNRAMLIQQVDHDGQVDQNIGGVHGLFDIDTQDQANMPTQHNAPVMPLPESEVNFGSSPAKSKHSQPNNSDKTINVSADLSLSATTA